MPARSPSETSENARRVGSWRDGPGRCRLWRALVRADARRSHPASLLSRRSAPLLCGPALAVTAAHGPAYQPSRHQHRRSGPAAEPSRGARSQAPARYERVREAGVITSQAVLIAIGIDWDGRRQVLAVELANRESRSSWR